MMSRQTTGDNLRPDKLRPTGVIWGLSFMFAVLTALTLGPLLALALFTSFSFSAALAWWAIGYGGLATVGGLSLLAIRLERVWRWQLHRGYKVLYAAGYDRISERRLTRNERRYATRFKEAHQLVNEVKRGMENIQKETSETSDTVRVALEAERRLFSQKLDMAHKQFIGARSECANHSRLEVITDRHGEYMLAIKQNRKGVAQ